MTLLHLKASDSYLTVNHMKKVKLIGRVSNIKKKSIFRCWLDRKSKKYK